MNLNVVQIFLVLSFSLCYTLLFSQEKSVQEQLMSKNWMHDATESRLFCVEINYEKTECIQYIILKKKGTGIHFVYYLSDSIETQFDNSKVGKKTNGKYIVYSYTGEKNDSFFIDEILELTDHLFKHKSIKGDGEGKVHIARGVPKENK